MKLKITMAVIAVLAIITLTMGVGVNNQGHRVVGQWFTGNEYVVFEPGPYLKLFGSNEVYNDIITFDFDKTDNSEGATIDQNGIGVRYQDGGLGTIYGIARYALPNDEESMLKIHKEFRSNSSIGYKLLKAHTEGVMNHTAGLMSSEESYAEKRGVYAQWARDQAEKGKYKSKLQKRVTIEDPNFQFCLEDELTTELQAECKGVKRTTKNVPVPVTENGFLVPTGSDLEKYSIAVSGFEIVDWGYETKTLDQIAAKREATMGVITANADAERAKAETLRAVEQGKKNVATAKYEKEVEKERAVVDAQKLVEVAKQKRLEAEQKKLTAVEYKQEQILRGEGDSEYKRLVIEADGALQQKLDAWKAVNFRYADNVGKQRWVPDVQMGGASVSGTSQAQGSNSATQLVDLLTVKTAKELNLDMKMK